MLMAPISKPKGNPYWKKGVSGNPSGVAKKRPKGVAEGQLPTREQVLRRLWAIVRKPQGQAMVVVAGCKALLEELREGAVQQPTYDAFFMVSQPEAPQLVETTDSPPGLTASDLLSRMRPGQIASDLSPKDRDTADHGSEAGDFSGAVPETGGADPALVRKPMEVEQSSLHTTSEPEEFP